MKRTILQLREHDMNTKGKKNTRVPDGKKSIVINKALPDPYSDPGSAIFIRQIAYLADEKSMTCAEAKCAETSDAEPLVMTCGSGSLTVNV